MCRKLSSKFYCAISANKQSCLVVLEMKQNLSAINLMDVAIVGSDVFFLRYIYYYRNVWTFQKCNACFTCYSSECTLIIYSTF